MSTAWQDFNDADTQNNFDIIPRGTIAPVRMTIKPGGVNDLSRGWTGGYATRARESDAVYLNCEFVVTQGEFAKRKIWSLIGLFSPKGTEWGNMGRSFIRAILNSSRSLSDKDSSPQAVAARRIRGFEDLDGIEFLAKIDVEKDQNDQPKNVIKIAITPDMKEYQGFQPSAVPVAPAGFQTSGGFQPPATFQPVAGFQPPAAYQQPAPVVTPGGWQTQQAAQPVSQPAPQPVQPAPQTTQGNGASFTRPSWAQ